MASTLNWRKAQARQARRARQNEELSAHGKPYAKSASDSQRELIRSLAKELGIPEPDGIATRSGAQATIANLKRRTEAAQASTNR